MNPVEVADEQHVASKCITAPLVALIALQVSSVGSAVEEVKKARNRTRSQRRQQQATSARILSDSLPDRLKRCVELASEKVASTWMEALPVREYGFHLSGTEFRDSLSLRYG